MPLKAHSVQYQGQSYAVLVRQVPQAGHAPTMMRPTGLGSSHSADLSPVSRSCLSPSGHTPTSRYTCMSSAPVSRPATQRSNQNKEQQR